MAAVSTETTPRVSNPVTVNKATLDFLAGAPKQLLINGKWVPAKSGKTFDAVNPATEDVIARVAEGDKADVDEAVKAARNAFESGKWSNMSPHQRARYVFKMADIIEAHGEELAELITLENGKPITESEAEVVRAVDAFRYYAGWATKIYGETNPSDPSFFNYTLREPVGVCGQIIPWNGPLSTVSWKVAPALGVRQHVDLETCRANAAGGAAAGELMLEVWPSGRCHKYHYGLR